MITFRHRGGFEKLSRFLYNAKKMNLDEMLKEAAEEGLNALKASTPIDSGLTSESWSYKITRTDKGITISWSNSNMNDGVSIALLIQYGHGVNGGGYISGVDYINPAMKPVFDKISESLSKEVSRL